MGKQRGYSREVREREVWRTLEHEHGSRRAAIGSVSSKIGCTAEPLRGWIHRAEHDSWHRPGLTSLERESWDLRRTNEIRRKASASFAQAELGRQAK